MGALVTYKCDGEGCESIKKEVNHWWVVTPSDRAFSVRPMKIEESELAVNAITMCSESCVSKALSRWMQGNK
jgi:hypothetical protein